MARAARAPASAARWGARMACASAGWRATPVPMPRVVARLALRVNPKASPAMGLAASPPAWRSVPASVAVPPAAAPAAERAPAARWGRLAVATATVARGREFAPSTALSAIWPRRSAVCQRGATAWRNRTAAAHASWGSAHRAREMVRHTRRDVTSALGKRGRQFGDRLAFHGAIKGE
jgi:hypothetical protein